MNRRLGQPAINIYKDDAGKPKGFATLSYEEPICAKAAVEHFDGMFCVPKTVLNFLSAWVHLSIFTYRERVPRPEAQGVYGTSQAHDGWHERWHAYA